MRTMDDRLFSCAYYRCHCEYMSQEMVNPARLPVVRGLPLSTTTATSVPNTISRRLTAAGPIAISRPLSDAGPISISHTSSDLGRSPSVAHCQLLGRSHSVAHCHPPGRCPSVAHSRSKLSRSASFSWRVDFNFPQIIVIHRKYMG